MFIREHSCFSIVAQVVSLAYRYSVTCSIVTTSFVVAVNITTLKPFNTVMDDDSQSRNRPEWQSLM